MTSEGHHLTPQTEKTAMFAFQIALEELYSESQVIPEGRGPCSNTRVLTPHGCWVRVKEERLPADSLQMGVYIQVILKGLMKLAVRFKRSKGPGRKVAFHLARSENHMQWLLGKWELLR